MQKLVLMKLVKGHKRCFQTYCYCCTHKIYSGYLDRFFLFVLTRSWSTCWYVEEQFLMSLTMTWNWTQARETWLYSRESKATVTSACCPCLNIITFVRWVLSHTSTVRPDTREKSKHKTLGGILSCDYGHQVYRLQPSPCVLLSAGGCTHF